LSCERIGGNKAALWLARHSCGHEQVLRADQLRSGRESLCNHCGNFNRRLAAQRIATEAARVKKAPVLKSVSLCEQVKMVRQVAIDLGAKKPLPFFAIEPLVEHEGKITRRRKVTMTPWQIGLEQAKSFSHFNF